MKRPKANDNYSKKEARERFEAALRGSRYVDPNAKLQPMKRGRRTKADDAMATDDAAALVEWRKRNAQKS